MNNKSKKDILRSVSVKTDTRQLWKRINYAFRFIVEFIAAPFLTFR